ncbi:MAG: M23 family metallopeptidase [Thermodesulfobacteriota bacterium]|nr:M23 family metallopeptidase [Thermodesulfobacteriota bacterium]
MKSYSLHKRTTDPLRLQETINRQHNNLKTREQQIVLLGKKLGSLETKLAHLENVENEIRKIARIERSINHENLFGVGGSKTENARQSDSINSQEEEGIKETTQTRPETPYHHPEELLYRPQKNRLKLILENPEFTINPMTCIPTAIPVEGGITKNFKSYVSPLTGEEKFHKGVLINVTDGRYSVRAAANGVVSFAGEKQGMGRMIVIDHGHGFFTRYAKLQSVYKHIGDTVQDGEVIGSLEKTGDLKKTEELTPEHPSELYYEVLFNGIQINPNKFINQCPFTI